MLLPLLLALLALLAPIAAGAAWWAWQASRRRRHPVPPGHRPEIEIAHRQDFELYHNALSLCSMKVRICLAELAIPYASHPIDLIETGAYENIRPRLLRVNPAGTVPVLVHRGHPIYESHLQIRYAAQHAAPGAPSLVPADDAARAEMERWIDRSSLTEDPIRRGDESAGNAVPGLTLPLFAAMIDRVAYWKIFEGVLFHFDRIRPLLFLTFKLVDLSRLDRISPAMKVLARSRAQMRAHLDALETQLGSNGGPWILGPTFSLADVSWVAIFERLVQADCLHVFVGDGLRPHCAHYWRRLRARPSHRLAILDHAHDAIEHGTARLKACKAASPRLRAALEGR